MLEAGQKLIGEHDFRNFCKIDVLNVNNFVRRILSFHIEPVKEWTL
jgi:tRNA pseudouridine38/39 synthase